MKKNIIFFLALVLILVSCGKTENLNTSTNNTIAVTQTWITEPTIEQIKTGLSTFLKRDQKDSSVEMKKSNWVMAYWLVTEGNDGGLWLSIKNNKDNNWDVIFTWKWDTIDCKDILNKYDNFQESFLEEAWLACKN